MVGTRTLVTLGLAALLSACSTAPPTAPTAALITNERHRFTGTLTGEWAGTYVVTGCYPTLAPNQCTWYVPAVPGNMRLSVVQNGNVLSGSFTSDFLGAAVPITGTVDEFGVVHLAGTRPGNFQCFEPTTLRDLEVGSWTTEVTKSGGLAGSFKQLTQQKLSSCYTAMYQYDTTIASLTRR